MGTLTNISDSQQILMKLIETQGAIKAGNGNDNVNVDTININCSATYWILKVSSANYRSTILQ